MERLDSRAEALAAAQTGIRQELATALERVNSNTREFAADQAKTAQELAAALKRLDSRAEALAAAQTGTRQELATALERMNIDTRGFAADQAKSTQELAAALALLDGHAKKLAAAVLKMDDLATCLQIGLSALQSAGQTQESSFARALTDQINRLTAALTPQLNTNRRLWLICTFGIVLVLALEFSQRFWH